MVTERARQINLQNPFMGFAIGTVPTKKQINFPKGSFLTVTRARPHKIDIDGKRLERQRKILEVRRSELRRKFE